MAFSINLGGSMPQYATAVPDYVEALSKGITAGMQPKSQAETLLGQMLGNKIQKTNAKYADQMVQADLALKQAQAQKALQPTQATGKLANLYRLRESMQPGDPRIAQVDEAIKNTISGSNGISIMTDPETGQQMIQIGGSGGKGSSGGKTFQTKQGEIVTQPTGATATNLQSRVVGSETVEPYLNEIINTLPQFQNPVNKGKNYAQSLSNAALGTQFKGPSEQAKGKAAIKKASEGMLKSFGLNATGANRQAMEDILKPVFGESEAGYKARVQGELEDFINSKKYSQRALSRGISLGTPGKKDEPPYKTKLGGAVGESRPVKFNGKDIFVPIKDIKSDNGKEFALIDGKWQQLEKDED